MRTSATDTDEQPVLAPGVATAGPGFPHGGGRQAPDRRATAAARRKARRVRRLYLLSGLAVLAGSFVATVVVVDMVR
jgi:hypothetical protein